MNSFGSQSTLKVGNKNYEIFRLNALEAKGLSLRRLPYSLRVLLENLLRQEDGKSVTADDIEFLAKWQAKAEPAREIAFMPARVLMQDFTGVPAIVDLAAMRDAMKQLGGDPEKINPLQPAELVIDHSVQVDEFGTMFQFIRHDGKTEMCACVADRRLVLGDYLTTSQEERIEQRHNHPICQQCSRYKLRYYFHLQNAKLWEPPV